ncbi:uncharacterized protein LOC133650188 isoform X2 [Entelurus aequoreus]|uniref:uncharacterized protein LOC133650188 isoform X2 n=1 Tax=Entelurus aequoreus TaxID=161455 RepID=UPI002B1E4EDA|nr:uncharacterized protein LOC133650188 isoform X2 [Entelurus aequoreus]
MATRLQRVAVVGAGAAGLCAARHILSRPDRFAPPVLLELSAHVGGTWCYEEPVGTGEDGRTLLSSMYRHLRTNLPKEVMMFPDFPFREQPSSFLPHQEVRRYLEDYCAHYKIGPHIRLRTAVEAVKAVVTPTEATWEVTSSNGRRRTETFDSVFVCSGHYSDPYIPDVAGVDKFKGQVLHSHAYRSADAFAGLSVVVLGAHASGLDISLELANVGAQVTLSHGRPPFTFPLPAEIQQAGLVAAVEDDGSVGFQAGAGGRPALLHRLQVQLPLPGRRAAGAGHPGPLGGAAVPLHDAARLPLTLLHRPLQDHLPLPLLPLSGPVRSGHAGRFRGSADPGPDGGRGPAGDAGEGGARRGAAAPDGDGAGPVGVPRHAGQRRRLPAAASGGTQPVRGGVATAAGPPPRLPPPQLQAGERRPVATGPRRVSRYHGN